MAPRTIPSPLVILKIFVTRIILNLFVFQCCGKRQLCPSRHKPCLHLPFFSMGDRLILEEVHNIVIGKAEVKDHIPEVIWSHKFEGTSKAKIRNALGIDDAQGGSRALYIIGFRKLRPITELSGDEFLRAWWHAVVCRCSHSLRSILHRLRKQVIVSSGNTASVIATSTLAISCFTGQTSEQ
jgi:hypothetical protein